MDDGLPNTPDMNRSTMSCAIEFENDAESVNTTHSIFDHCNAGLRPNSSERGPNTIGPRADLQNQHDVAERSLMDTTESYDINRSQ
jgi:hypothetical protein